MRRTIFEISEIPKELRKYFEEIEMNCGAPWKRVVEKKGGTIGKSWHPHNDDLGKGMSQQGIYPSGGIGCSVDDEGNSYQVQTTGWQPGCRCSGQWSKHWELSKDGEETRRYFWRYDGGADTPIPCIILDPFGGSGTTALVAGKMDLDSVICELKPEYVEMARQRLRRDLGHMLIDLEVISP